VDGAEKVLLAIDMCCAAIMSAGPGMPWKPNNTKAELV